MKACVRILVLVFMAASWDGLAQKLKSGPQVLTFHSVADDTEQPYALYLPSNFQEDVAYPLVIMLHGAGSNHRLALRRVFGKSNGEGETDVEASRYFPEWDDVDYIVAAPFARGTAGYQGIVEQDVYAVLEDVKERFHIDSDRIYLTGLSMGGGGTLWLGLTRPDIWAAIAPVCPAPPTGTADLLGNALHLPVHFFHGDADPVVPIEGTRAMVEEMQRKGILVLSEEYEGVKHDSWVNAYAGGRIFEWFSQYKRNPFPETVSFTTHTLTHHRAYWVALNQLVPGSLASIEASIQSGQKISVDTKAVLEFTLHLKDHPAIDTDLPLNISIDGRGLRVLPDSELTFYKDGSAWRVGSLVQAGGIIKRPGQSGPVFAGFADRHIYVYGTADNPSAEELERRRLQAYEAANWSAYRGEFLGRVMFFPRILADKEVRTSDLASSNLILFGFKETNSIIRNMENQLPVHLDPADTDHGLLYIYPHNDRYVVVNSGLPWWGGSRPAGFTFVSEVHQKLPGFKDFKVYKGNPDEVLAEGFFDTRWQFADRERDELRNIEVITLK
ncbi:MAG: prolyl oligopeptidase family serine peptidase [Lunatimonas sp.]|uniref:carboxylesterase family protein n=1 Tax=Lunatimonas sp. TaxID=2060141 RepID=UPI00263AED88|nr:prolyl oligopeptidase family serine peptidase [Lunatimonas sp.]MCC5936309.1 prolyl oligopeptidase family serine peptidase [Lunatimonas sp.]